MRTIGIMDQLKNIRDKQIKTDGRKYPGTSSKSAKYDQVKGINSCFGCNSDIPLLEDSVAIDTPLRKRIVICRNCDDEKYEYVIKKMKRARCLKERGTEIKWIYGSDGKIHAYQTNDPKTPICSKQVNLKGRNCNPEKMIPVVCKICAVEIRNKRETNHEQ